jgi:hypothetical protein
MSYILIIDSTFPRAEAIAKQCKIAFSNIDVYHCESKNGQDYRCQYYKSNSQGDGQFYRSTLPIERPQIAFWHYRDDRYQPHIEANITLGFGGGGRESQPMFSHHIIPKLSHTEDVCSVLSKGTLGDLWNWSFDITKYTSRLRCLLHDEHNQSALLALQLLCKTYLIVHGDLPLPSDRLDSTALISQKDRVNNHNWWTASLSPIFEWQQVLVESSLELESGTESQHHRATQELIKSILTPESWNVVVPELRKLCRQCLKVQTLR